MCSAGMGGRVCLVSLHVDVFVGALQRVLQCNVILGLDAEQKGAVRGEGVDEGLKCLAVGVQPGRGPAGRLRKPWITGGEKFARTACWMPPARPHRRGWRMGLPGS